MSQKVIDKIQLGVSAILNRIYVYIPEKDNPENMKYKKDVTDDICRIVKWTKIDELKKAIGYLDILLDTLNTLPFNNEEDQEFHDEIEKFISKVKNEN